MTSDTKKNVAIGTLTAALVASLWFNYDFYKKIPVDVPQAPAATVSPITENTEVSAAPKATPEDADVILTQAYTATVNGQTITVPVKSTPQVNPQGASSGVQGTSSRLLMSHQSWISLRKPGS